MAAVERRVVDGVWRLPAFATHADRRLFKQQVAVRELLQVLPERTIQLGFLGPAAAADLPDPEERRRLIARAISFKSGPEGAGARDAISAWRALERQAERTQRAVLPASAAVVAATVERERLRAAAAARGSRGGATCAERLRKGLLFLANVCRLPVDADSFLVEAAARPEAHQLGQPRTHAASLPLCVQMQLEALAAAADWSVARCVARAFLVAAFAQNTRLNDALNARIWCNESDPTVIRGRTAVRSKDGLPLDLFAPAEGYLGPWEWWPAHAREFAARPHALPDFDASAEKGPAQATRLLPGVMPPSKAVPALRCLCAMAPLRMSRGEFVGLGITGHSIHGTGADMARFLGEQAGFVEGDARELGHWLRDKNAPQQRAPVHGAGHGRPAGARNGRDNMERRYTQGAGRRGEEAAQLRVRCKLVQAVRDGMARFGRPWTELPRSLESWDVLVPGAQAQLGPDRLGPEEPEECA